MTRTYRAKDVSTCFPSQRLVFAGDSNVRDIFWAVAKKLDAHQVTRIMEAMNETDDSKHSDINFSSKSVELRFLWDPYINSTSLTRELVATQRRQMGHAGNHSITPSLLLIGAGSWFARYLGDSWQADYQNALARLFTLAAEPQQPTRNVSFTDSIIFLPVQTPVFSRLSDAQWLSMTGTKLDTMNALLMDLSMKERATVLWSFIRMTRGYNATFQRDGVHNNGQTNGQKADVLLNLLCNSHVSGTADSSFPHNKSCCGVDKTSSILQPVLLWICLAMMLRSYTAVKGTGPAFLSGLTPSLDVLKAIFIFGSTLFFCYIADRTYLMTKEHKHFDRTEFLVLVGIIFLLGLLTIRRSSVANTTPALQITTTSVPSYLSRDQTDEMKGWMQAAILVYHWTGASQTLWIYQIVRVLVAAYLFLTGFGHTVFFLKKDDYSFKRLAMVLLRLNLLSCALPFIMGTNYLFYYFAPLSSFWFVVVYATTRIKKSWNDSASWFSLKIYTSLLLLGLVVTVPGIMEGIFDILYRCCNISWNAQEWRFRTTLDLLIVHKGMLLGFFYHRFTSHAQEKDYFSDRLSQLREAWINWVREHRTALSLLCFSSLVPYFYLTTVFFNSKQHFNHYHVVLSIIPILAFLAIRNICRLFRTTYSWAFAWLGRISLETFTLQYHIWLAADTKGVLRVGLASAENRIGRWIEIAILTVLFLYASWWMAWSTQMIISWLLYRPKVEQAARVPMMEKERGDLLKIEMGIADQGSDKWKISGQSDIVVGNAWTNGYRQKKNQLLGLFDSGRRTLVQVIQQDLRIRLALILLGMWYLNMKGG